MHQPVEIQKMIWNQFPDYKPYSFAWLDTGIDVTDNLYYLCSESLMYAILDPFTAAFDEYYSDLTKKHRAESLEIISNMPYGAIKDQEERWAKRRKIKFRDRPVVMHTFYDSPVPDHPDERKHDAHMPKMRKESRPR